MKLIVIPTRDNAWMVALWVPFLLATTLIPGKELHFVVSGVVSVVEIGILIWVLWRMRTESAVEFDDRCVRVTRRGREIKQVELTDIERIVLSAGTFSLYGHRRSFPLVMRAIRARNKDDKERYIRAIQDWSRKRQVMVQG